MLSQVRQLSPGRFAQIGLAARIRVMSESIGQLLTAQYSLLNVS
jgi:hypothetical protein